MKMLFFCELCDIKLEKKMLKQQVGVVGMAVMGRNLALNIESKNYRVSIFNRTRSVTEEVMNKNKEKKFFHIFPLNLL